MSLFQFVTKSCMFSNQIFLHETSWNLKFYHFSNFYLFSFFFARHFGPPPHSFQGFAWQNVTQLDLWAFPKSLQKAVDYLKMNIFVINTLNLHRQQDSKEPKAMSKIDKLRKKNSYAYRKKVSNPVDFLAHYHNLVIESVSRAETLLLMPDCYYSRCWADYHMKVDSVARLEGEQISKTKTNCVVNRFFIDSLSRSELKLNIIYCEKMLQKFNDYIVKLVKVRKYYDFVGSYQDHRLYF